MRSSHSVNRLIVCASILSATLILDQWTKSMASRLLAFQEPVEVIPTFFQLVLVHNPGATFGILSTTPAPYRNALFALISIGAFALLVYPFLRAPKGNYLAPAAIMCVAGGAAGNIIDRIRFGYVIDFLDFYIGQYHWPTFNIADSAITTGIGLLIIHMLMEEST
jgi:signal peptidase II